MIFSPYLSFQSAFFASIPPKFAQRLARQKVSRYRGRASSIPESETLLPFPGLKPIRPVIGSTRTGLLGYKIGNMGLWDEWGARHMVSVVKIHDCVVTRKKTIPRNGYEAVQLSCGSKDITSTTKAELGECIKLNICPKDVKAEFRVSSENLLPVGLQMSARHFVPGQWVFVAGTSKPRGYLGAKRSWGMSGQSKTHGTTKGENTAGCTGQGKGIGKVWKYKKMDGHRGDDPRVVNCKVFRIDASRGLLFLAGCVPGAKGSILKVYDARGKTALKNRHISLPFPTFVPQREVKYPILVQQPPLDRDPFLFPDKVIKEKRVKA